MKNKFLLIALFNIQADPSIMLYGGVDLLNLKTLKLNTSINLGISYIQGSISSKINIYDSACFILGINIKKHYKMNETFFKKCSFTAGVETTINGVNINLIFQFFNGFTILIGFNKNFYELLDLGFSINYEQQTKKTIESYNSINKNNKNPLTSNPKVTLNLQPVNKKSYEALDQSTNQFNEKSDHITPSKIIIKEEAFKGTDNSELDKTDFIAKITSITSSQPALSAKEKTSIINDTQNTTKTISTQSSQDISKGQEKKIILNDNGNGSDNNKNIQSIPPLDLNFLQKRKASSQNTKIKDKKTSSNNKSKIPTKTDEKFRQKSTIPTKLQSGTSKSVISFLQTPEKIENASKLDLEGWKFNKIFFENQEKAINKAKNVLNNKDKKTSSSTKQNNSKNNQISKNNISLLYSNPETIYDSLAKKNACYKQIASIFLERVEKVPNIINKDRYSEQKTILVKDFVKKIINCIKNNGTDQKLLESINKYQTIIEKFKKRCEELGLIN